MGTGAERGLASAVRWRWYLNTEGRLAAAPLPSDRGGRVAGAQSATPRTVWARVQSASTARSIGDALAAICSHLWVLSVLVLTPALVLLVDFVPASTHNSPTVRATLETVMTLFAFGGAWLLRAQFDCSRRLRDLVLLGALLTLGMTSLISRALVPLDLGNGGQFEAVALWGELFVAAAFAAAAFAPADRLIFGDRPTLNVAILSGTAVAVAELGGLSLRGQFVGGAEQPLELAFVLLTTGLLIYGALMFAPRDRIDDNGGRLLAAAAILLAAASFSHIGLPLLASQRAVPREAVSFLASALLFAAAARQELQMRKTLAQAAAMAERRRIAQDLHDGLAQDLAFIVAHGERIAGQLGDEDPVAIAAKRALATSRCAITEMSDPAAATAQEALDAIAYELHDRFGITIAVHARLEDEIAPDVREQVARIAREAIANAARHGGAKNVVVSLKRTTRGVVLRVTDDGSGIGTTPPVLAPESFGLRSMSDRAASMGGQLTVRQPRSGGTELEVLLP